MPRKKSPSKRRRTRSKRRTRRRRAYPLKRLLKIAQKAASKARDFIGRGLTMKKLEILNIGLTVVILMKLIDLKTAMSIGFQTVSMLTALFGSAEIDLLKQINQALEVFQKNA